MSQFVDTMTSREGLGALAPHKATGVEARTTIHKSGCLELTLSEEHGDDDFWEEIEQQEVQVLLPKHFFPSKAGTSKASYESYAEPNPEMSPTSMSPTFRDFRPMLSTASIGEPNPEMSPCLRGSGSPVGSVEPCPELSPCVSSLASPIMSPMMPSLLPEVDSWPFSAVLPKQESCFARELQQAVEQSASDECASPFGSIMHDWDGWDMLAGMVQQPLTKENPADTLFAFSLLAGSVTPKRGSYKTPDADPFVWDMLAGMVQQPLAEADPHDTLAWDLLAGMVQQPLVQANPADTLFAFSMLAGSAIPKGKTKIPYKVPDADPFVWNMLAGSAVHQESPQIDLTWNLLEGMVKQPKEWGESWFAWEMMTGTVKQPLAKANPADTAFAWSMLAGSAKPKPIVINHEWRRRLYEAEEAAWWVWHLLAGSAQPQHPLAKADPADTLFAFDLLKGSAKKASTEWYYKEETLVWDMLAESASPKEDTWGESWFAWQMLAGMVQHPLAKASASDTEFAWKLLAGSAIRKPRKVLNVEWRRKLIEAEEASWWIWNLLAGSAQGPLAKADPADTWFAFDLLKGSAKKASTELYYKEDTLVWDMLAESAKPKEDEWGESWFAWQMLAGMVQHPLGKARQDDTWFAFKMLLGFCKQDKSFLTVQTPVLKEPLEENLQSHSWFVWDMLAGSCIYPQLPLAKADPNDTWFAFDLLAGMVRQPLAKMDPTDMLAWELLAGSAFKLESELAKAVLLEEDWAQYQHDMVWHMLAGSVVMSPLARANPDDTWFAFDMLAGSVPQPLDEPYRDLRQMWWVWDLLAGSVIELQSPLAKASAEELELEEQYGLAWTMLVGSVPSPLAAADPANVWSTFDMLAGMVKQPLAKANANDMWFAFELLAGSAKQSPTHAKVDTDGMWFVWDLLAGSAIELQSELGKAMAKEVEIELSDMFIWEMLAGMVKHPLAKADPADVWFAWDLLGGSGKEIDWESETLAWSLLAGSVPQPAKVDPYDMLAWDMIAGMVKQPLSQANPADMWFAWRLLADSAKEIEWESETLVWDLLAGSVPNPAKADPDDMLAWDMLAGSVPQPLARMNLNDTMAWDLLAGMVKQPLAKADPADMWFAWSLLAGSAKEFDWESETLVWDLLAGSVPQPAKMDPNDHLAWNMLARSVKEPLAKADSSIMWFAWDMLAGSAISAKPVRKEWDWESKTLAWDLLAGSMPQPLAKMDSNDTLAWDTLTGMVKQPLAQADPADMWFAWSLLAGSAKEIDWESETLVWDLLAGSVPQPVKMDPNDHLAWKMLAGSITEPLAKADSSVMWFAWDLLAGSAIPANPVRYDWSSKTLAWDLLSRSVSQPAKADPYDTLAWDMLSGMLKQPLAEADPADMWFAWDMLAGSAFPFKPVQKPTRVDWSSDTLTWDLLAGSAIELQSELGKAIAKEVEMDLPDVFVWEMLAGMVKQPLAKADPADMWFAWDLLAGSGKEIDWESETLAWDLLAGSVPQPAQVNQYDMLAWDMLAGMVKQPLAKADSADMWLAWDMLAGSEKHFDWESETLAWDMLAGSVPQPLAKMNPNDTLAWDLLAGSVKQPVTKSDPCEMWFAWGLLNGMVQQSFSKNDTDDMWFDSFVPTKKPFAPPPRKVGAWNLVYGSAFTANQHVKLAESHA